MTVVGPASKNGLSENAKFGSVTTGVAPKLYAAEPDSVGPESCRLIKIEGCCGASHDAALQAVMAVSKNSNVTVALPGFVKHASKATALATARVSRRIAPPVSLPGQGYPRPLDP